MYLLMNTCHAAWAELLETHRTLLRQAFAAHGGHEVDTQGDSFFAVFRLPSNAVAAARAARQSPAAQQGLKPSRGRPEMSASDDCEQPRDFCSSTASPTAAAHRKLLPISPFANAGECA